MAASLVPYFVAGTILFFFWAYGVVSLVLDIKNKFIPLAIQWRRNRKRRTEEAEAERERAEKEKQLY
ncbi:MAG: hypothetical protein ABEJ40_12175 [Haloarculaceae archaeon]